MVMDAPVKHSRKATRCGTPTIARKCTHHCGLFCNSSYLYVHLPNKKINKHVMLRLESDSWHISVCISHASQMCSETSWSLNRHATYISLPRGCRDWSRPPAWIVYNVAIVLRRWCMALADWLAPPPLLLAEKATAYAQSQVLQPLSCPPVRTCC